MEKTQLKAEPKQQQANIGKQKEQSTTKSELAKEQCKAQTASDKWWNHLEQN